MHFLKKARLSFICLTWPFAGKRNVIQRYVSVCNIRGPSVILLDYTGNWPNINDIRMMVKIGIPSNKYQKDRKVWFYCFHKPDPSHTDSIYTGLPLHPFNCTRNSPHRHLTKFRSYGFEHLWMQINYPDVAQTSLSFWYQWHNSGCACLSHVKKWHLPMLPVYSFGWLLTSSDNIIILKSAKSIAINWFSPHGRLHIDIHDLMGMVD